MANLATINNNILADSGIDPLSLIVGTGTVNYVPKFTAEDTVANSQIFDNGTDVGIGTSSPFVKFDVRGEAMLLYRPAGNAYAIYSAANNTYSWQFGINNGSDYVICGGGFTGLGVEAFRITLGGNVGIGTTSPVTKLDVNGAGVIRGFLTTTDAIKLGGNTSAPASTDAFIYRPSDNTLAFGTASAERMRLDVSGNLLIGLSSALANGKLQVAGSIGLSGNTQIRQATNSDGNTLQVFATQVIAGNLNSYSYGYSGGGLLASVSAGDSILLFDAGRTTSTEGRVKITNTTLGNVSFSVEKNGVTTLFASTLGNVGIGTSSPSTKLHISNAANGNIALFTNTNDADLFINLSSGVTSLSPSTGILAFGTSSTERMRLDASGNLGLGTSSPAAKLHVAAAAVSGTIDRAVIIANSSASGSGSGSEIYLGWNSPSINAGAGVTIGASYAGGGTNMLFSTPSSIPSAPNVKMTLDGNGNLGLGVTPSAWTSTWRAIQLPGGSIYSNAGGTTGQIAIGQNWYYDGTQNRYINSAAASDYYQYAGEHRWFNAPSGTAGNAISFTQAMTLNASGQLLIGTTSAQSGTRLQVAGFLDVWSSANTLLRLNHDGTRGIIETFTGGGYAPTSINPNGGNVLIGTTTDAGYKLDVSGTARITSNLLAQKVQVGTAATINDPPGVANTLQFANYTLGAFITGSADNYIYKNSNVIGGLSSHTLIFQTRSDVAGGGFAFVSGTTPSVIANISSNGAVRLNAYGSGSFTGTVAYNLAVDASGNIIETAGGVVDGSGTANYVPLWSDPNTLTNSTIYQTGGGNVGINTASPAYKLDVNGTARASGMTLNAFATGTSGGNLELGFDGTQGVVQAYNRSASWIPLFLSGSDMRFYPGGVEKMRLDSVGNLGIGTTSPQANLVVQNASGTSIPSLGSQGGHFQLQNGTYGLLAGVAGSGNVWMQAQRTDGTATAYNLLLQPNGGNVGIGTTSPSYKLEVNLGAGNSGIIARFNAPSYDEVNISAGLSNWIGTNSTSSFSLRSNNTDRLTVHGTTGNVLIGTTTDAGYKLDVNGSGRFNGVLTVVNPSNPAAGTIEFGTSVYKGILDYSASTGLWNFNNQSAGPSTTNYFQFQADGTPIITMRQNGNVGIGTTSPGRKLEIASSNADSRMAITNSVSGGGAGVGLELILNNADASIINYVSGSMIFGTNSTERMRITSGGNVGIGTSSPGYKLEVVGNIQATGSQGLFRVRTDVDGRVDILGQNGYAAFIYFGEVGAADRGVLGYATGSGDLVYRSGANAISNGTERLRVKSTGAVQFNAYGSGSFTGTRAYDLSVDASGNIIEVPIGAGTITGSGTTNYIPKWTSSSAIGNSDLITDGSGNLAIAQGNAPTQALNIYRAGSTQTVMAAGNSNTGLNGTYFGVDPNGNGIINTTGAFANIFSTNGSERMRITSGGDVGIGTTAPSYKLDVQEVIRSKYGSNEGRLYLGGTPAGVAYVAGAVRAAPSPSYSYTGKLSFYTTTWGVGSDYGITEQMYIDTTAADTKASTLVMLPWGGSVGIGTTTPSSILDARVSSGATSGFRFKGWSDSATPYLLSLGTQTYQDIFQIKSVNGLVTMGIVGAVGATPDLAFQTNSTERMRITSGGNVLIGTTTDVSGVGKFVINYASSDNYGIILNNTYTATSNNGYFQRFYNNGTEIGTFYAGNAAGSLFSIVGKDGLSFATNGAPIGTERMRIATTGAVRLNAYGSGSFTGTVAYNLAVDASGNIIETAGGVVDGSGTTNYVPKWSDPNTLTNSMITDDGTTVTVNGVSTVYFKVKASTNSGIDLLQDTAGTGYLWNRDNAGILFGTNNTERMRLDASGNLGLGNSAPSYKFDILGSSTNGIGQIIKNSNSNSYFTIDVYGTNGFGVTNWPYSAVLESVPQSTGGLVLSAYSNGIYFQTGARQTRMTLDASGNLGLGVSPSAWSAYTVMQITNGGALFAYPNPYEQIGLINNGYFNGSNWIYTNSTSAATRYQQYNGEHLFYTASGGTAGNAISFTQAMTLDASGRLGIGTTSPDVYGVHAYNASNSVYFKSVSGSTTTLYGSATALGVGLLGTFSNSDLTIYTNSSEKMRITSGGNVGIGTSSPANKLQIGSVGSTGFGGNDIAIGNGSQVMTFYQSATISTWYTNTSFSLMPSGVGAVGNVGIGTTSPSNRLTVSGNADITGNVGIGTPTPAYKLDVLGSFSFTTGGNYLQYNSGVLYHGNYYQFPSANDYSLFARTSGALIFGANDTERMRITSGGNVGIGTSSPTCTLDVRTDSGVLVKGATSDIDGRIALVPASGGRQYGLRNYGSSFGIKDESADVIRMYFHYDGNTGMGTTSPGSNLTIQQASTSATLGIRHTASGNGYGWRFATTGTTTNDLIFSNEFNGSFTERMRITSGGIVGIGTSSPDASTMLQVQTSNSCSVRIVSSAASGGDLYLTSVNGGSESRIDKQGTAGPLTFYNNGSERMRITSSGNTELSGSIKTGTPSGGTAVPWKLGSRITNSCGLPGTYADFASSFMVSNKVIEVEIDGVLVYIPIVNPGWC